MDINIEKVNGGFIVCGYDDTCGGRDRKVEQIFIKISDTLNFIEMYFDQPDKENRDAESAE